VSFTNKQPLFPAKSKFCCQCPQKRYKSHDNDFETEDCVLCDRDIKTVTEASQDSVTGLNCDETVAMLKACVLKMRFQIKHANSGHNL